MYEDACHPDRNQQRRDARRLSGEARRVRAAESARAHALDAAARDAVAAVAAGREAVRAGQLAWAVLDARQRAVEQARSVVRA